MNDHPTKRVHRSHFVIVMFYANESMIENSGYILRYADLF